MCELDKNIEDLILRLRKYNEWRRGAETDQPNPTELGRDIDLAICLLEVLVKNTNRKKKDKTKK